MKTGTLLLALCLASLSASASPDTELRYTAPAAHWTEALPVGNGRLGAMVFGDPVHERLQLNEDSLWSGGPSDTNNPGAREVLPKVRAAVFAGNYAEADRLCTQMQGPFNESYQTVGSLWLSFPEDQGPVSGYERVLDLETGVLRITYSAGGARYTREVFCSNPDQVIVVRFTCDHPGRITFTASADSPERHAVSTDGEASLLLRGTAPSHADPDYLNNPKGIRYDGDGGMRFTARARVVPEGGRVKAGGATVAVQGADSVTLLIAAATSYNGPDRSPVTQGRDPEPLAKGAVDAAEARSYEALLRRHESDYQALFGRVHMDLGHDPEAEALPTDARLARFNEGKADPGLPALLFQFGRYLLISSSRPGGLPANLQGLWNDSTEPPWSCNWTLNINTEMNYWPSEVANLAECHEPLFDLIDTLAAHGRKTASINYGAHGWVAHHNADLWGQTGTVGNYGHGDPVWANWPMSGAWLCRDLWEHYAFGGDTAFLRDRAWPVMKGSAEFYLDWLIDDGKGHLVTCPSVSPEEGFRLPDGRRIAVSMASSMDMELIWDLFTHCIDASRILGVDAGFAARLEDARARLYPLHVGSRGQLQEWFQDTPEEDVHHRHLSHLVGVYPGSEITPATPETFAAARRSLEIRGDDSTGWSLAWKISLWARFRDGQHAFALVKDLLHPVSTTSIGYGPGGGVYVNLLDACPPFQIDGNFGFTAGVSEMLLQSHLGSIDLLPALPREWPRGKVSGLRARGGFELTDLEWSEGRLARVGVRSTLGGPLVIRSGDARAAADTRPGEILVFDGELRRLPQGS
jgi:alpha-L-fucosidase 2